MSVTTLGALLGSRDNLGCSLLTEHKVEIKYRSSDTVQSRGSLMLRCGVQFPGKELAGPLSLLGVSAADIRAYGKTNAENYILPFALFFSKIKNPLWISSTTGKQVLMLVF